MIQCKDCEFCQFSPDGKRVAYRAGDDNKQFAVVANIAEMKYQIIMKREEGVICVGPRFINDNTIEYIGAREDKLYRVSALLPTFD